ncbi:MAG: hypothetical protein KGM47_08060 [Acidobacteriota bacterium]|nr:hypothetical protein [Acidobacteriota bacterium]
MTGAFGNRLCALILTGSLARNEAAVEEADGTSKLLGDAEFLLVFADDSALPRPGDVRHLAQEIEARLARHGVAGSMDLDAIHPSFLRALKPHIFAYELRKCGHVVWGDQGILNLIPPFTAADIPLEDAWRLLCNRMIEQLEVAPELGAQHIILPPAVHYRTVKLYRDMATSFLIFTGGYEPTYRGRAERLNSMSADPSEKRGLPFPLIDFSNRVSACTGFMLQGRWDGLHNQTASCPPSFAFWQEAISQARLLWRWELMRLTGGDASLSDQGLMETWMKMQPVRDRLRGWAYVLRECGWRRSWREWPRWLRLAWRASPRYCVYSAATRILFDLPSILDARAGTPATTNPEFNSICSWLPANHGDHRASAPRWVQAVSAVSWNYLHFLKGTRA